MGVFHDYVNQGMKAPQIDKARRDQLVRIGQIRKSSVVSYVARLTQLPIQLPTSVVYDDLLPFHDLVNDLDGGRVTVVLETPGGFGEIGREMVERLHEKFDHVTFIVPGMAKSTGTIMVMGAHEIIMSHSASLGPIDAQLNQDGKQYSADALLEGLNRIKNEVEKSGKLNAAYIPILQRVSPGELEHAWNSLQFSRVTVAEWLAKYKFADWEHNGAPVSDEHKKERADEIAEALTRQSQWYSHGRSLRIPDLQELGLRITPLEADPELSDAVLRYHALLRLTFEAGPVYKIIETQKQVIAARFNAPAPNPAQMASLLARGQAAKANLDAPCQQCGTVNHVQINIVPNIPADPEHRVLPEAGILTCANCKADIDLRAARQQILEQLGVKGTR